MGATTTQAAAAQTVTTEANVRRGGTLRTAYPVTDLVGPALDPRRGNGHNENETQSLLFNTLVFIDNNLTVVPELAKSWSVSNDGLSYRFILQDGVTFHDGTPMTSADVKYTYDFIRNPDNASPYLSNFNLVKDIIVHGDQEVEFILDSANPDFLPVSLGSSAGIVPQAYAEQVGPDGFNSSPIGTGPFRFVEWVSGERVVVERYENYWRQGVPYLDRIELRFIPEDTVRLISLETGEIDHFYRFVPPTEVSRLKDDPKFSYVSGIDPGIVYLMINTNDPALTDKRVRQAIGYAVDREAIAVAFGGGTPGVTTVLPNSSAFDPSLSPYKFDAKKARSLYQEAGSPDLSNVTLLGLEDYPTYNAVTVLISDLLSQAGMKLKLDLQPRPVLAPRRSKGEFSMVVGGADNLLGPDASLYNLFHSKGKENFGKYANPELDRLLEDARTEPELDARNDLYKQAQKLILDDAPLHCLLYRNKDAVMSSKVKGYELYPVRTYRSFEKTWIDS